MNSKKLLQRIFVLIFTILLLTGCGGQLQAQPTEMAKPVPPSATYTPVPPTTTPVPPTVTNTPVPPTATNSSTNPKCPPDGSWETGDKLGLTGFDVSSCQVKSLSCFLNVNGSLIDLISSVECTIEQDGKFTCQKKSGGTLTVIGTFLSNSQSQGTLIITKDYNTGFGELGKDFSFEWTAIPSK